MQVAIANQGAWQQSSLAKDLKTVTDSEHKAAALGEFFDRIHDRRKTREGAGAQVVAVGEASRNDHRVVSAEIRVAVPDKVDRLADVFRDHVIGIVIAIRTRKDNNAEFQASISTR